MVSAMKKMEVGGGKKKRKKTRLDDARWKFQTRPKGFHFDAQDVTDFCQIIITSFLFIAPLVRLALVPSKRRFILLTSSSSSSKKKKKKERNIHRPSPNCWSLGKNWKYRIITHIYTYTIYEHVYIYILRFACVSRTKLEGRLELKTNPILASVWRGDAMLNNYS